MEEQEFLQTSYCSQFPSDTTTTNVVNASSDHFIVEDLFDFSNDVDGVASNITVVDPNILPSNSTDGSPPLNTTTTIPNSNFLPVDISCRRNSTTDANFSTDLSVPYDELAELEWLSKFGDESFSCEDMQRLQLISGMKMMGPNDAASQTREESNNPQAHEEPMVFNPPQQAVPAIPAKARSKRSRGPPCNWTSRLIVLSPTTTIGPPKKPVSRRRDATAEGAEGRRCLHCDTDKTPQWRTGPQGPKTLCNACGVRYKSGRLVPEYRPAASPTFMLTKHSNSHRKVLELRRQKEMTKAQQQQLQQLQYHHQTIMYDHHHHVQSSNSSSCDDYLIHQQHVGPDFTHLM